MKNTYFQGAKTSRVNLKLFLERGANDTQTPLLPRQKYFSENSIRLFGHFFHEKEGVVSEGGKLITPHLEEKDKKSLACVNRSSCAFFAIKNHY